MMKITLGNILMKDRKSSYAERYTPMLGEKLCRKLFGGYGNNYCYRIAYGYSGVKIPYQNCNFILDDEMLAHIAAFWKNSSINTGFTDNPRDRAESMITDPDSLTLKEDCPELYDWLLDAIHCGKKYLLEIFNVLTLLAITRGCWNEVGKVILAHPELLPKISGLPNGKFYRDDFPGGGNLWDAFTMQKNSTQAETFHEARELLLKARAIIAKELEASDDDYCKAQLKDWEKEISRQIMQESFKAGGDDVINTLSFIKDSPELYGEACYHIFLEKTGQTQYLAEALKAENPDAMFFLMKTLLPLDSDETISLQPPSEWDKAYGLTLAHKLIKIDLSQSMKGEVFYRLYVHEAEDEEYLRKASACGAPEEAVKLYSARIVSYKSSRSRGVMSIPGQCIINSRDSRTLALTKTLPENWQLSENFNTLKSEEAAMCLLCKDDAGENLKDFVRLLDELTHKDFSCAIFFIMGSEELLTPLVDTALNQWHAVPGRQMLRVQIIDEGKDAAQHLLAMHPLFYPAWQQGRDSITFVVLGNGPSIMHLKREAKWLLPSRCEIVSCSDDEKIISLLKAGEPLYFAVDNGNTLANMTMAIHIRELVIRHWVKENTTKEPPDFPIAFYCGNDDADLAFLGSRTVVLGDEFGSSFYNNYGLIPYHARYFDWNSLIGDTLDRLALCVHMLYWQIQPGSGTDEGTYRAAYQDYARRTYNRDSSIGVALSLPYRVWQISPASISDRWDIKRPFLSEQNMAILAESPEIMNLKRYSDVLASLNREIDSLAVKLHEGILPPSSAKKLEDLSPKIENLQGIINGIKDSSGIPSTEVIARLENEAEMLKTKRRSLVNDEGCGEGELEEAERRLYVKILALAGSVRVCEDRIESFAEEEHRHWNIFMESRGWKGVSAKESWKYIEACTHGKKRHQLYVARLHPCITGYLHLDSLAESLETLLGTRKPFKDNDRMIIFSTADLLKEICFEADNPTARIIRQLFGKEVK